MISVRIRRIVLIVFLLLFEAVGNLVLADEAPLKKEGGVFTVPVMLNGAVTVNFTIDSGAAEIFVPPDVVLTLIRAGTITDRDYLPGQVYELADGSRIKSQRFSLRTVQVGGVVVKNVEAAIGQNVNSGLLLGQSFLSRLKTASIDYERNVLIVEGRDSWANPLGHSGGPDFSKIVTWFLGLFGIEKSTLGNLAFRDKVRQEESEVFPMTLNDFTDRPDRSLVGPMRADGSRLHLTNEICRIKGSQLRYEGNRVLLIEASGLPRKIEAVGCWVQTEADKIEIMFSQGGSDYRTTWVVDYPNWVSSETDPIYHLYRSSHH